MEALEDMADAPVRRTVADETREMLQQRLVQAEEQVEQGTQLVHEWSPVVAACKAGLQAISERAAGASRREFALPLRGNGEYDRPIR